MSNLTENNGCNFLIMPLFQLISVSKWAPAVFIWVQKVQQPRHCALYQTLSWCKASPRLSDSQWPFGRHVQRMFHRSSPYYDDAIAWNACGISGPSREESTGYRWIPYKRVCIVELWYLRQHCFIYAKHYGNPRCRQWRQNYHHGDFRLSMWGPFLFFSLFLPPPPHFFVCGEGG